MIAAAEIEALLAGLDQVGRSPTGFRRLAWTPEEATARAWFERQAGRLGLAVERDRAGNLWACPPAPPPWRGVGSHLDTVAGGGRYDGALGVACAFAVAARFDGPLAVVSFADEEGARFNTPTFGSRALVGRLDAEEALARSDAEGTTMAAAMRAAGLRPEELADAGEALARLSSFVEVHIDQSRELAEAGLPAGAVTALAGRMRVAVVIEGEADHAGTTRRSERSDAMAAAARLIVAAEELADDPRFVVTPTRLLVEPNALSTIAGEVRLWLDARAAEIAAVDAWREALAVAAVELGRERRVRIELTTASRSPGRRFDESLKRALLDGLEACGVEPTETVCFAGHDAGVLAERIPAGMVLVRNPTGVSHSPAEEVDVADAAVAADVVLAALRELG
ncbi:MAG: hydantoinase/carbamoylase family amidase [Solirubrobacterales bacterium]